ncbi:MAG: shikimate dehydrogenase [Hyphomicrobiaceae bacterium]|nr:shikimate dehydrogenase [Hyphomicrobiaceae bacterium]
MITGRTKLFCIVADPIEHVRTPQMFNAHLESVGIDAVLVPAHVTSDRLPSLVSGLRHCENLLGIVVTLPHKIAIVDLCDELHGTARLAGAANILRREPDGRLTGANFDGIGFLRSLEEVVASVRGRSVYLAGAGGVARAIAFSLAGAGASRLSICNRSEARAAELLDAVRRQYPDVITGLAGGAPEGCDIAINATLLGLRADDPLPFSVDALPPHAVVADVVMEPIMTPLLKTARRRGLNILTGDAMLRFQLGLWVEFIAGGPAAPALSNGAAAAATLAPKA